MNVKELSPEQRVALCQALSGAYEVIGDRVSNKGAKLVTVIEAIAESFSDPEPGSPVMLNEADKEVLISMLDVINGRRNMNINLESDIRNVLRKLITT